MKRFAPAAQGEPDAIALQMQLYSGRFRATPKWTMVTEIDAVDGSPPPAEPDVICSASMEEKYQQTFG